MKIVLISQQGCNPCTMVKNYLLDNDVEFEYVNITEFPEKVIDYNIMSTPVTILIDEDEDEEVARVAGFEPSHLDVLISQL